MHEYHLIKALIDSILKKTAEMDNLERLTKIKVKLGDLKMVGRESFLKTFKELSAGTICDGATIDLEEVKGDTLLVEAIEGDFKDVE